MGRKLNIVLGAAIALIVIASAAWYVLAQLGGNADAKTFAVVHDGEGATHALDLSLDQETIITTDLGSNVVVVENGAVFVRDADCDNLDCVHQGKIDAPGRQIICLPHKLWIEVVEEGASGTEMNVDAVAGDSKVEGDGSGSAALDAVAR